MTKGLIFGIFDVKGEAIEASASERLSPTSATFKAEQSFAPSPHIPTICFVYSCNRSTKMALFSGLIHANTLAFSITECKVFWS